jgi:hypothetical protein
MNQADEIAVLPTTRLPSLPLPPTGLHSLMIDLVSDDLPTPTVLRSFRSLTRSPNLPSFPRCSEMGSSNTEFRNSTRSSVLDIVRLFSLHVDGSVADEQLTGLSSLPVSQPVPLTRLTKSSSLDSRIMSLLVHSVSPDSVLPLLQSLTPSDSAACPMTTLSPHLYPTIRSVSSSMSPQFMYEK